MQITDDEAQKLKEEFRNLCLFFARECVNFTLETLGEEKVQDSQRVYDCVHDMLIGVDLTQEVLTRLKERLDVR